MRRRDLFISVLPAFAAFVAVAAYHDLPRIVETLRLLAQVHGTEKSLQFSLTPYVLAFVRIIVFYIAAGAATGIVFSLVAWVLGRPSRRRYFVLYCALLAGFILYIHLRMITLHPGLFRNSYRYAWFAGSSTWAFVVEQAGRIALAIVLVALVLKLRPELKQLPHFARRHRTAFLAVPIVFLALLGLWAWQASGHRRSINRGPNIVFVSVEAMRPDHISALGYSRPTTPHIDAFLKDAVRFDRAFVAVARTYPAWIALLTGCYPAHNGVRCNLPSVEGYLPHVPTMPQHLKPLGYFSSILHDTSYAWFEPPLGFDYIAQPEHTAVVFYLTFVQPATILYYFFLNNRLGFCFDPGLRHNSAYTQIYRPELFAEDVAGHLGRMREKDRFLAVVHLTTVHVPFSVSYPYSTYFEPPQPVLNRFTYALLAEEIARRKQAKETRPKEEIAQVLAQEVRLYDALLRSSDDSIGCILDGLKRAGLYDNSLIVVMSDHGENLFRRGLRYRYQCANHGNHLWGDDDQRMFLAIKFPGQKHAGEVVERLVRSIDITPTILDALGLPALKDADGVSLMPYVEGREKDMHLIGYTETELILDDFYVPRHLDYAFRDHFELHCIVDGCIYKKPEFMANIILAEDRAVRDERWKLIAYPIVGKGLEFQTELFDVVADPRNLQDVSTSHPDEVKRLRAYLWPHIENDLKQWGPALQKELLTTTETVVSDVR
jgi:arylsulfatase A-like enzyme